MADEADDLGIPMKPTRPPAQPAPNLAAVNKPTPLPGSGPRPADLGRPGADPLRPADPARRIPDPAAAAAARRNETEVRKLIVGREISLSGEITSCDRLIVEGSVEANLQNCREVDIAESGMFKGSASIDEAEVRGRFEGNLVVRKRLLIRSTGRVSGSIRYGQIEIECGGQIAGEIQGAGDEFISELPGARASY